MLNFSDALLFGHPSLIYSKSNMPEGEFFMADASAIAKSLTAAWIRNESTSKSAIEAVEFYRTIYDELIDEREESQRSSGDSLRFDRYDAASLLLLVVAAAFILLPVLLT